MFFVSAYWHGVHGGYYLMAALVFLYTILEAVVLRAVLITCTEKQQRIISWMLYFLLWRFNDFITVPFMLLEYNKIINVWAKMYYVGFIILFVLFLIPYFVPKSQNSSFYSKCENKHASNELKKDF